MSYDYVDLKHLTNGDNVRMMNDEELAEWLSKLPPVSFYRSKAAWLQWLKKEAEDG